MAEAGRPTVMTTEVLRKLEEAFANAFTDKEACLYADISPTSLYKYCQENPAFAERKEILKLSLNMHAKNNISKAIKTGDVNRSIWWATTKMSDEFAPKSKLEHSGAIESPAPTNQINTAVADALREEYETRLRASIVLPPQGSEPVKIVVEVGERSPNQTSGVLPITL